VTVIKEDVFGGATTCDHTNIEYEPAENCATCADCGTVFVHTDQTAPEGEPEELPDVEVALEEQDGNG